MPGRLLAALLALALCASAPLAAAPLVLKDDYRSPRNGERPVRRATTLIVLHTTEAPAKSSLNKLCERGEAHYCVTEDGTVYRIVDKEREAFHAGRSMWNGKEDCDEFSIGIEVVGHHDKAVTLQQIAALRELVARLKRMYKVPDGRVVCHSHIAYGAPNTWHKKKHRGRKRCGMLFAMPSVRSRLGLAARVAYDPDVKAKRLVQADPELAEVLYGTRDTMVAVYSERKPSLSAAPSKPKPAAPKAVVKKTKPAAPKAVAEKPKSPPPKAVAEKPKPVAPKAVAEKSKPPVATPVHKEVITVKTPPPIVKPAKPKYVVQPQEEEKGVLSEIGGFFKNTAKLIIPKKKEEPPATPVVKGKKLTKPPQILTRDPRDLAALEAMPGYVKGGPVSDELSPYRIAGAAWRSPTTYYYMNGRIVTGDRVNEKLVEKGSFIFYKK